MSTREPFVLPLVLAHRLRTLRRRVHASHHWGYRVAELLAHLAADSLDAFGRTIYAEFVKAVVRGMPSTPDGTQAYDLIQEVHHRGADALPPGYGKPFAIRVYKILLAKFGDPDVVEQAMADVVLKAVRRRLHIANGSSLHSAETYVIVAARTAALDILRARGRRKEVPIVTERDDDGKTIDVEDPNAFIELEKHISPGEMEKLIHELRDVHPRAPEWLRARLDGDSGQEISEDWGTTPSYVSKWQRTYLPKIKEVVQHHLREGRERSSRRDQAYSYDYQ